MSEYGSGITMKRAFEMDRERIVEALKGRLLAGEDQNGFIYEPAPKEECDAYILSAFDNAVYMARDMAASGRALSRIAEECMDSKDIFQKYMGYREEERVADMLDDGERVSFLIEP